MKDHEPGCQRAQFWDAGEWEAPCTCDWIRTCRRDKLLNLVGALVILALASTAFTVAWIYVAGSA